MGGGQYCRKKVEGRGATRVVWAALWRGADRRQRAAGVSVCSWPAVTLQCQNCFCLLEPELKKKQCSRSSPWEPVPGPQRASPPAVVQSSAGCSDSPHHPQCRPARRRAICRQLHACICCRMASGKQGPAPKTNIKSGEGPSSSGRPAAAPPSGTTGRHRQRRRRRFCPVASKGARRAPRKWWHPSWCRQRRR